MCVAVVWDRRQRLCERGCCEACFVLCCVIGSWRQLATWTGVSRWKRGIPQLALTWSLCRDVVFRCVFQCEVDWSFAELLLSCVGDHSMLCIMARCDGFLTRLSFLCMSGDTVCVAWL